MSLFAVRKKLATCNDAELLDLYCKTREPGYLVELYGRYTALVYGVALKYFRNVPDAQDAVMQIWEDLFQKVQQHNIQMFRPWLYACVRNFCLMELRKRSGNPEVNLEEKFMEFCEDFHLEDKEETGKSEQALQECLEALPERQRCCVSYFYLKELSYKEIVAISGFSLKMVKSCIQNGKRNLRLCLEKKGIRS